MVTQKRHAGCGGTHSSGTGVDGKRAKSNAGRQSNELGSGTVIRSAGGQAESKWHLGPNHDPTGGQTETPQVWTAFAGILSEGSFYEHLVIVDAKNQGRASGTLRSFLAGDDNNQEPAGKRILRVASPERSRKRMPRASTKTRPRPKASLPVASAENAVETPENEEATGDRNVGSVEAVLSMGLGMLLVVGALFPRSIKQLLMLGLGGGLVYRGIQAHCGLYRALGIDTIKTPLLK